MASLLTGLHPAHHGVRTLYPDAAARSLPVGALPRRLAGSGYATNAVGGYCATVLREVAFGFNVQRTPTSEIGLVVSLAALRAHPLMTVWLRGGRSCASCSRCCATPWTANARRRGRRGDRGLEAHQGPFFEVVFFGNAHQPYVPVAPEATAAGTYDGPNRYTLKAGDLVEQVRLGETGGSARTDPKEARNLERLYDGAVRGVDRAAGRVLDALDADGLAESTIVIALADHGENLMDGGGPLAHGEAVERDDSNAIPLSFRWPGRIAPRRIDTPVSLVDVAPTLAHALGVGDQPSDGISLWPALSSGAALPSDRGFLFENLHLVLREGAGGARRPVPGGRCRIPTSRKGCSSSSPGIRRTSSSRPRGAMRSSRPSNAAWTADAGR
jgi:hypothetical protein